MSVNRVILIGRLGRDPETRYTQAGDGVCTFSIATSESWRDKNTGQRTERTEWHNIVLYRKLAEIAQQYLTKGKEVYIEGRIQSRKYTGKDGVERTAYEIVGDNLQMLGSRNDAASAPMDNGVYAAAPQAGAAAPAPAAPRKVEPKPAPPVDDLDDDIPF